MLVVCSLHRRTLISEIPVEQFDTSVPIEVGMAFQAQTAAGVQIVRVTKVSEKTITVDANNEMAGKNLHFEIEILDVREPTEEELSASQPRGAARRRTRSRGGADGR